jgi:hypothetical protein
MPQPMLDAFDGQPGVALVPMPVKGFGHQPELDDEVAGEVLRLDLASFLAPQAEQGGFIVAHNDPGVGAANKAASICRIVYSYILFTHRRLRYYHQLST